MMVEHSSGGWLSGSVGCTASQQCDNSDGQKDKDELWFGSTMGLEWECDWFHGRCWCSKWSDGDGIQDLMGE